MHWRGAVHDGTRWLLDPSRTSHNYCELCVLELVFTCFQPFDLGQCHHQQVGSGLVKVCYLKFYFSLTLYLVGIQCICFKCSTTSRVLISLKAAFVGSATEELPLPKRVFSVSLKRGIYTKSVKSLSRNLYKFIFFKFERNFNSVFYMHENKINLHIYKKEAFSENNLV